jgi:hypothetical protein
MRRDYYVYAYLRGEDTNHGKAGDPVYIGKGSGRRAYSMNRRVKPPENPAHTVFPGQNLTEGEAFELERTLIAVYGRIDLGTGCLANLTEGGEGASGNVQSEGTLAKLSAIRKGKKHSPETIAKIAENNRIRVISDQTRANMSAARKGRKPSPEAVEKLKKYTACRGCATLLDGNQKLRKCPICLENNSVALGPKNKGKPRGRHCRAQGE